MIRAYRAGQNTANPACDTYPETLQQQAKDQVMENSYINSSQRHTNKQHIQEKNLQHR